jgi:hypothetical protein
MKRSLLSASVCLFIASFSHAQVGKVDDVKKSLETQNKDTVAWIHSGIFTVGANEGFLHNWAAGGEVASLAVNSVFHGDLTYLNHGSIWSNSLDLAYGLNYAYSNSFVPRKTDDRIDFTSKFGSRLKNSTDFFYTALFNFKSQFTKGYDYTIPGWQHMPTSDFMSPAYLTLALGMEYKKGADLSLFLSPLAGREILASSVYTSMSPQGAFGIDSGKTAKFQLGAYFSGRYKTNISKSIAFSSRLDLYSNYLAKDTKDTAGRVIKKDNPGNIQILWDNLFVLKAYKSLSLTFGLTMAYDNNIPFSKTYLDKTTNTIVDKNQPGEDLGWLQISQVFTFGIAYKF